MKLLWVLVAVGLCGCSSLWQPAQSIPPNREQADTTPAAGGLGQGKLLSAFFGLDNRLPVLAGWRVCEGAGGKDGMPVIFDREIDVTTLQAGDFRVKTRGGVAGTMTCVTMMPAADPGELRTVLLVGEFGSAASDPPETVEVVGHVLSRDRSVDYVGARVAVTALAAGPVMVLAEWVDVATVRAGKGSWARGSGCAAGTKQVVRVVWSGGVRLRDGDELGDLERRLYKVQLEGGKVVAPMALGDLDDGDNNHLLCLDTEEKAVRVTFPAGVLVDPNRDVNPATTVVLP